MSLKMCIACGQTVFILNIIKTQARNSIKPIKLCHCGCSTISTSGSSWVSGKGLVETTDPAAAAVASDLRLNICMIVGWLEDVLGVGLPHRG